MLDTFRDMFKEAIRGQVEDWRYSIRDRVLDWYYERGMKPQAGDREKGEEKGEKAEIIIRRDQAGYIDEVVALDAKVHLERMDVDDWCLIIESGDEYTMFYVRLEGSFPLRVECRRIE